MRSAGEKTLSFYMDIVDFFSKIPDEELWLNKFKAFKEFDSKYKGYSSFYYKKRFYDLPFLYKIQNSHAVYFRLDIFNNLRKADKANYFNAKFVSKKYQKKTEVSAQDNKPALDNAVQEFPMYRQAVENNTPPRILKVTITNGDKSCNIEIPLKN